MGRRYVRFDLRNHDVDVGLLDKENDVEPRKLRLILEIEMKAVFFAEQEEQSNTKNRNQINLYLAIDAAVKPRAGARAPH
jgi:hypothetical protein